MAEERTMRPPTLIDVAERAGVSQPTASRVLNGSDRPVSARYRARVLAAADELGYSPNPWAQTVRRGSSRVITLVGTSISGPFFASTASAVIRAAYRHGLATSISVTARRPERELQIARQARSQRSRAIVFSGTGFVDPEVNEALVAELQAYEASGGQVVMISRTDLPFTTIGYENSAATARLASALVELGYRRFLVLGSATPLATMQERVDGFVSTIRERGIGHPDAFTVRPVFTWQGAFELVMGLPKEMLDRVDLLFAITDEMALGAMTALRRRGYRVPGDMGVAGFNDVDTLRDLSPALTTVNVPIDDLAAGVVDAIVGERAADSTLPTYPVIRESTPRRPPYVE